MILLDENIPEDQCQLLRSWRIRARQIGQEVGRQGMKDDQHILPLLHKLDRPTLLTRDLGFFDKRRCHQHFAIICLAVSQNEVARFIRRFLRHQSFNSKRKRMGTIVLVSGADIRVWRLHALKVERIDWPT